MARAYNFSPGPATLPEAVLYEMQAELLEYQNWRASVMEVSHRGEGFLGMARAAEATLRELMDIGEEYAVLFLAGGARGQAAAVPLNLAADGATAAYAISGHWSRLAAEEGGRFCRVHIAGDSGEVGDNEGSGDSGDARYTRLPEALDIPADAAYLHIAENETVHGVEYPALPHSPVPIVADLTSNILTRRINVADYGLIYASAQKNLGAAGVTVVIVRRDLPRPQARAPLVWDYLKQAKVDSMCNTPPTFQIYLLGRMLAWVAQQGGVAAMEKASRAKAALLYDYLDGSDFYLTPVRDAACRSRMNVPFFLADEKLTAEFLSGAEAHGLIGLKGHAAVGGIRASLYNGMSLAGVAALVEYLREFERVRA